MMPHESGLSKKNYVVQLSKIKKLLEIRAKIKGKFLKTSKTEKEFRLRRTKSAKPL